jgi:hypothetical protein
MTRLSGLSGFQSLTPSIQTNDETRRCGHRRARYFTGRLDTGITYLDAATRALANLSIRAKAEVDSVMLDGNRTTM